MKLDFKDLSEVDLKLKLLSGSSIYVGNLEIKPYTLKEISEYGYSRYMQNLQWISLSVDDFINSILDESKRKILEEQKVNLKAFDFYIKLGGQELQDRLMVSLAMIFRTNDVKILNDGVIAIDFVKLGIFKRDNNGELTVDKEKLESLSENEIKLVDRDNFDDIIHVVKLQNYLDKPKSKEPDENPADEETRKLMEHMKKLRKKVEEAKRRQQQAENSDDGEIDLSDIISAVSSKSNSINKLNIWDLTLYQLYDEYARLELIDNYDFSVHAMMHGAEKIQLKHWASKL